MCNTTWYFENVMAGKCAMEANKRKKSMINIQLIKIERITRYMNGKMAKAVGRRENKK